MQHPSRTYKRLVTACLLALLLRILWGVPERGFHPNPALSSSPPVLLRLRTGEFDPAAMRPQTDLTPAFSTLPAQLYIVQFPGPIQNAWFEQMEQSSLEIVTYIPDYAYLVWGTGNAIEKLQQLLQLHWAGAYLPEYAVHPELSTLTSTQDSIAITVQLFNHPMSSASLKQIEAMAVQIVQDAYTLHQYYNITVLVPESDIARIAALTGVISIEPAAVMQLNDEVQGMILAGQLTSEGELTGPGYMDWLTSTVGFPEFASFYPIVDVTDDGIDNGSTNPLHPDFYKLGDTSLPSRVKYTVNWTSDLTAESVGGHGNLNAAIVAGCNITNSTAYEDANGYQYGLGINPFGRVAASKVFANAGGWSAPSYDQIVGESYQNGARIINNSWGESLGNGEYTVHDQAYDYLVRDADTNAKGNQEISIIFSAGNAGPLVTSIGSPANAKNVISVGASENLRPTWMDGCLVGSSGADDVDDIINFSSRGPTADGRVKPEIVAPGTHILGAASQTSGYLGTSVCDKYHPIGQTLYAASSGTSHAAPAIASAASLLHWFTQSHYALPDPSPAMVKAYLVNSAVYMTGESAGDTLPSPNQGFGRLDIGEAFADTPRLLIDQSITLKATGEVYSQMVRFPDINAPVRITLAWTDAPGPSFGAAYVNNLDLEVQINGNVYKGNVFSGGITIPGGEADPRNNVESIVLPAATGYIATVRIIATNIAGDGLPGNADLTDQDFALVCSNCDQPPFAVQVNPHSQSVCLADNIIYTVSTTPVSNNEGTINLNTQHLPLHVQGTFSTNPITIEAQSELSISVAGDTPPGDYMFNVIGTDLDHGGTVTQSAEITIDSVLPGSVSPISPTNKSVDVSILPTFIWSEDALASSYHLEMALDDAFSQPVLNLSTTLTNTTLTNPLAYATEYYWRITPVNGCGSANSTPVQRFITRQAPLSICNSPGMTIPDNNTRGITDTLIVPAYGDVLDMQVHVSVTHEFVGDLQVTLSHIDSGLETLLLDRPGYPASNAGCAGQNVNITLDDNGSLSAENACRNYITPAYIPDVVYTPSTPLSIHNGGALGGTWALNITDLSLIDYGTLDNWCLIPTIRYHDPGTWLYMPFVFKVSNF